MRTSEIAHWFEQNWGACKGTVKDISNSLVCSDVEMYSFDQICGEIYRPDKKPASVDAVNVSSKSLELIEFKTGFEQKISKDSFIEEKPLCQTTQQPCKEYEEYMELFFDKQELERHELIKAIYLKAVESYITFEKHIFPLLPKTAKPTRLRLTVVIDEHGIDYMEDTLRQLGNVRRKSNNAYESINSSLRKIINAVDCNGQRYYYQGLRVMSADEFLKKIQK